MDYDFVEGGRPRLQLQSGENGAAKDQRRSPSKVHAAICACIGIVLIGLGLSLESGLLQFGAIWLGLSLVLGPFAPLSQTGGDCRVGVGEPVLLEALPEHNVELNASGGRSYQYNSREKHAPRQPVEVVNGAPGGLGLPPASSEQGDLKSSTEGLSQRETVTSGAVESEKKWGFEDVNLLKKLMVKHPRGTLRRWEVIAEALGGKYNVESVVKMSKSLGQKKTGDSDVDAYSRFLTERKGAGIAIASPLSQRDSGDQRNGNNETVHIAELDEAASAGGKGKWSEVEDKALLTALKTFPKDSPLRWDKVAVALPGRTKAQCFRRFSELRKSVRNAMGGGSASHGELAGD